MKAYIYIYKSRFFTRRLTRQTRKTRGRGGRLFSRKPVFRAKQTCREKMTTMAHPAVPEYLVRLAMLDSWGPRKKTARKTQLHIVFSWEHCLGTPVSLNTEPRLPR